MIRRLSAIELAIGIALLGSVLAVALPAFVSQLHASRFVEATDGLEQIGASAVRYAVENGHFPDTAPLTPAVPPRGKKDVDPVGTWSGPTWVALGFRPVAEGVPHAYAFAFESAAGAAFTAQARGDLDGDGTPSLFEIKGDLHRDGGKPGVAPGMYIESELE